MEVEVIALLVSKRYEKRYGHSIDEMKLQKILFYIQKEYYGKFHNPLFSSDFVAGEYGPIILSIHSSFPFIKDFDNLDLNQQIIDVVDIIIEKYGKHSSLTLSFLSRNEKAWQLAIKRCFPGDGINEKLRIPDFI